MRKNVTTVVSVLSLALLLTACQDKKQEANHDTIEAKQLVGVVDTARIYAESKAAITGGDYLEKMQMDMQKELIALQDGMNENASAEMMTEFQEKYANYQERVNLEQEQVVSTLNAALQKAMDTYRKDHGLELLIPSEMVMSMSDSADVTDGVIAIFDGMKVEFTPVVIPEKTIAPAPVAEDSATKEAQPEQTQPEEAPNVTEHVIDPASENAQKTAPAPAPEAAQ